MGIQNTASDDKRSSFIKSCLYHHCDNTLSYKMVDTIKTDGAKPEETPKEVEKTIEKPTEKEDSKEKVDETAKEETKLVETDGAKPEETPKELEKAIEKPTEKEDSKEKFNETPKEETKVVETPKEETKVAVENKDETLEKKATEKKEQINVENGHSVTEATKRKAEEEKVEESCPEKIAKVTDSEEKKEGTTVDSVADSEKKTVEAKPQEVNA